MQFTPICTGFNAAVGGGTSYFVPDVVVTVATARVHLCGMRGREFIRISG